jgi:hypothetical protein
MSDTAEQYDDNPALQKLTDLKSEFQLHVQRIDHRSNQIQKLDGVAPEVKEIFSELSQTVMSLQASLIDAVVEAVKDLPPPEAVSMLLAEDADIIGAVLEEHQDMLNQLIAAQTDPNAIAGLKQKLTEVGEALALLDEITVDDGEEGDGEEQADPGENEETDGDGEDTN